MNFLLLYNASQTFTNTVFEHLDAFSRFSSHRYFFCNHDNHLPFQVDLARFDAVGIHYCCRLPYDQISEEAATRLAAYRGLKFLYIQDEYEHTHRAWYWIRRLGIQLVFTVVPEQGIARVYPPQEFPGVRFVSNLTGYVPEHLPVCDALVPPSRRELVIGYRGRPLPVRFGALGQDKVGIGRMVRQHCEERGIRQDIAWTEDARIYGPDWYGFMASCRTMLGSESGSNVFDWDGTLAQRVADFRAQHPSASDDEVYARVIQPLEQPGLMNQISPRVFEAIALRTALVQFEGTYSGVIQPWIHYVPLKRDGSNLDEVFAALADGSALDAMTERAWQDVIGSGRYGYPAFLQMTDREMEQGVLRARAEPAEGRLTASADAAPTPISTHAERAAPPAPVRPQPADQPVEHPAVVAIRVRVPREELVAQQEVLVQAHRAWVAEQKANARVLRMTRMKNVVVASWQAVPQPLRPLLRPIGRRGLIPAWRLVKSAAQKLRS